MEEKCMKKRIKMKVMAILLVLAFTVAVPVTVPFTVNTAVAEAATVKISNTKLTMGIGETKTLKISGTKSKITWKSSKKAVVTVTSKGVVTAQSVGTANITATVNKKKYTCKVTVNQPLNPYQVNASQQEVQIAGLSVVVPSVYEVTTGEAADGSYTAKMSLPDSKSSITLLVNKTGEAAVSYEDVAASFDTLSMEELQQTYDDTYGAGTIVISELSTFSYESQNKTTSFAYSFIATTAEMSGRQISYNLSIDDYMIEVVLLDVEGYDLYIDAEYLIDSLMYIGE
jgi:hypothetical protein